MPALTLYETFATMEQVPPFARLPVYLPLTSNSAVPTAPLVKAVFVLGLSVPEPLTTNAQAVIESPADPGVSAATLKLALDATAIGDRKAAGPVTAADALIACCRPFETEAVVGDAPTAV